MLSPITRCHHCQNVILADLGRCPECASITRQGWRKFGLGLLAIVISLTALAFAGYMLLLSRMGK
jgi:RNA polymerase subunit RPABC4/transcription elongation factor Spt4